MNEQDKQLLLKDLCARLLYGVIVHIRYESSEPCYGKLSALDIDLFIKSKIKIIKPYLRPLSSMTFEERSFCLKRGTIGYDENDKIFDVYPYGLEKTIEVIDFLNAHHFDYRGLIEKGLALEAPEGMYEVN
jgi:hypothetical protein